MSTSMIASSSRLLLRPATFCWLITVFLFSCVNVGAAQISDSDRFVEGYVFDSNTMQPLKNSNVVIQALRVSTNDPVVVLDSFLTDANGFYSGSYEIPISGGITVVANCLSSGRITSSQSSLITTLSTQRAYTRNLYLKLPRASASCRIQ